MRWVRHRQRSLAQANSAADADRQGPEPVLGVLEQRVEFVGVGDAGEAGVEVEADVRLGNVGRLELAERPHVQLRSPIIDRLAPRSPDHLLEKVLVEAEADQVHVAGLVLAGEVAPAAGVEVLRADRESRCRACRGGLASRDGVPCEPQPRARPRS